MSEDWRKDHLFSSMGNYCERCKTGVVHAPFGDDEVCLQCAIKEMKARWG